jgi:hypothetical protein
MNSIPFIVCEPRRNSFFEEVFWIDGRLKFATILRLLVFVSNDLYGIRLIPSHPIPSHPAAALHVSFEAFHRSACLMLGDENDCLSQIEPDL